MSEGSRKETGKRWEGEEGRKWKEKLHKLSITVQSCICLYHFTSKRPISKSHWRKSPPKRDKQKQTGGRHGAENRSSNGQTLRTGKPQREGEGDGDGEGSGKALRTRSGTEAPLGREVQSRVWGCLHLAQGTAGTTSLPDPQLGDDAPTQTRRRPRNTKMR